MKVKLTQAGMETYSGLLGDVVFQDGVSSTELSAAQVAALLSIYVGEIMNGEDSEVAGAVVELAGAASAVVGEPEVETEESE
jgi:predicted nucleotidyltransferase